MRFKTDNPILRAVMVQLVRGRALPEICKDYALSLTDMERTVQSPMFQKELERVTEEIATDVSLGDKLSPAYQRLLEGQKTAVERIITEIDNTDPEDKAARTRLQAAFGLLDRTGMAPQRQKETGQQVQVNIFLGPKQAQILEEERERTIEVRGEPTSNELTITV